LEIRRVEFARKGIGGFAPEEVHKMAQKSGTKKTAQSRPSSRLCRFLLAQKTPVLLYISMKFWGYSRKNGVIAPKFRAKTVNLGQKRQKYCQLSPT
jgi:hypothetical protein